MKPLPVASASAAEHAAVFVCLEFSESHPVRDIQRVSALIAGALKGMGQTVELASHSAAKKSRIETSEYVFRLNIEGDMLKILLMPNGAEDRRGHDTEVLLARLVRMICPVLEPSLIYWNDTCTPQRTAEWLATFKLLHTCGTSAPNGAAQERPEAGTPVLLWPNRPHDFGGERACGGATVSPPEPQRHRYETWNARGSSVAPRNRFGPEPLACRAGSWTLTAVTAILFPPAGASMAVLNIGKGANLRLNLHVLTLTLIILSLQQSGALATTLRMLGF